MTQPAKTFFRRLSEIAVALVIAICIITLSQLGREQYRELVTADAWFRVDEIYVPDHTAGDNPVLLYDRTILEPFTGYWIVEVQKQGEDGLWALECTGSGSNHYEPEDVLDASRITWQWFLDRPCRVPRGHYRLKATWTMVREGWPVKTLFAISNEFEVLPQPGF